LNKDIYSIYLKYENSIIIRIKEKKSQNSILLLGHSDDIPEIISAIDILVYPSENESFLKSYILIF